MKAIGHTGRRKEIIDSYLDYFNAYTARHWDELIMWLSEDVTMFGTGVDEVALDGEKTRELLLREFQQAPLPITYKIVEAEVFEVSDHVVYLMLIMDMQLICKDIPVVFESNRTTAIMTFKDGRWKLVHGHWSQPDRDIDVGESVPYRLLMERSRQLEEKVLERTKKIIEQKEELEKINRTKDKLLSVIAHDLKNPFNSILGFSEILAENPDQFDCDKLKSMCRLIHQQAQSAHSLLDNMLQWAKMQTDHITFNPEPLLLKKLVEEAIEHSALLSHKKETEICVELENDLYGLADRHMLQVILHNLLSNAIKFTGRGGKVWVHAEQKGGMIHMSVRDNGVGISEANKMCLQQGVPVEATKGTDCETGTGLGLLLCSEFIQKMNGSLNIESIEGEGSCFYFTIPANVG